MGGCASSPARQAHNSDGQPMLMVPSRRAMSSAASVSAYQGAAGGASLLAATASGEVNAYITENRVTMGKFMNSPVPDDPDAQLLRVAACSLIFSAEEKDFRFFAESPDAAHRLNDLTIQMNPASMNFGCTAVSLIIQLSKEIRDAGEGIHNEPMSPAQLLRATKLKLIWKMMLDAHSVHSFEHPRLGQIPIVQPVLHSCIQWRGAGMGNGEGDSPDPIFQYLLDHGARVDIANSLGLSTLHVVLEACEKAGSNWTGPDDQRVNQSLEVARLMIKNGASVLEKAIHFSGWTAKMRHTGVRLEKMLADKMDRNVLESCQWWQGSYKAGEGASALKLLEDEVLQEAAKAEKARSETAESPSTSVLGDISVFNSSGWQDKSTHPMQPILPSPTWVQAIFNTIWLVSRLTALETASQRRKLLTKLAPSAPFQMPIMGVVSYNMLKDLGVFPRRDTSKTAKENGWKGPIPVYMLDDDAIVLFLSHRWLQPGNPDDAEGTKFKQIMQCMELVAEELGGAKYLEKIHLWADFSCIDQSNPFPGVQMLPAYMACCEEMVYVVHPEYDERAWCRTEQFMHWRLQCHQRKFRLEDGIVMSELPSMCADPAFGKLYCEADRVALVNMTSLFQPAVPGSRSRSSSLT